MTCTTLATVCDFIMLTFRSYKMHKRKMAAAKTVLLLYTSSVGNVAVLLVPFRRMQAERSIGARNWADLRAQTLKPF